MDITLKREVVKMNSQLQESLFRDLFVFSDEKNPRTSQIDKIWPPTVLDQVFDHLSPTGKNLRQILEELRQEIITGGIGNIVFPVMSVNGRDGDVSITAFELGLGKVDNTKDLDKPLSTPQRNSIMEILSEYDFTNHINNHVNLGLLMNHLLDKNNPHNVSIPQLNKNNELTNFVNILVSTHSLSLNVNTHPDIRRGITQLWNKLEDGNAYVELNIDKVLNEIRTHMSDPFAHEDQLQGKEDTVNKVLMFNRSINNNHDMYPSTRAVTDFIRDQLIAFGNGSIETDHWITDIIVIPSIVNLPEANEESNNKAYIIREGASSKSEIAICRRNELGDYGWEIHPLFDIPRFNPNHFTDISGEYSIDIEKLFDLLSGKVSNIIPPSETNRIRRIAEILEYALIRDDGSHDTDELNAVHQELLDIIDQLE